MDKLIFKTVHASSQVRTVTAGPFYLVAHKSGEWSCNPRAGVLGVAATGKARNQREAERAVVRKAREQVAEWSSQLDQLTEDLR